MCLASSILMARLCRGSRARTRETFASGVGDDGRDRRDRRQGCRLLRLADAGVSSHIFGRERLADFLGERPHGGTQVVPEDA